MISLMIHPFRFIDSYPNTLLLSKRKTYSFILWKNFYSQPGF